MPSKSSAKLTLTNLDKVFWPKEGYTKGDVIGYYEAIAPFILPHIKDRPMVLNRHPNGINGESFFQKNTKDLPSWIETAPITHSSKTIQYLLVQDKDTLIYVANLGCIELNPFHSRVQNIDNPDYLVFDLDPEAVHFDRVIEAALVVHELLDNLHLQNYCKTSGGRGLHIYVPLGAKYDYQQVQHMGQLVALMALQELPDLLSLERSPAKRQKQIYLDVPRNARGQTIACPYCIRPRPGAPVSTPLEWDEVKPGLDPLSFNLKTVPQRVKKVGDLFKPVLGRGADFQKALKVLNNMGLNNRG